MYTAQPSLVMHSSPPLSRFYLLKTQQALGLVGFACFCALARETKLYHFLFAQVKTLTR